MRATGEPDRVRADALAEEVDRDTVDRVDVGRRNLDRGRAGDDRVVGRRGVDRRACAYREDRLTGTAAVREPDRIADREVVVRGEVDYLRAGVHVARGEGPVEDRVRVAEEPQLAVSGDCRAPGHAGSERELC